jgi:hypothetical protein
MATCQLREKTLTEKHLSSKTGWGWSIVDNKIQKNDLSRNEKKVERQGLQMAVEPMMTTMTMMMMMMMSLSQKRSFQPVN